MNDLFESEAIVLKQIPHQESGVISTLLTATYGIVTTYHHRPKKKAASNLYPLAYGHFILKPSRGSTTKIIEFSPQGFFPELRSTFSTLQSAIEAFEHIMRHPMTHQEQAAIYPLLMKLLHKLPSAKNPKNLKSIIAVKILKLQGCIPNEISDNFLPEYEKAFKQSVIEIANGTSAESLFEIDLTDHFNSKLKESFSLAY